MLPRVRWHQFLMRLRLNRWALRETPVASFPEWAQTEVHGTAKPAFSTPPRPFLTHGPWSQLQHFQAAELRHRSWFSDRHGALSLWALLPEAPLSASVMALRPASLCLTELFGPSKNAIYEGLYAVHLVRWMELFPRDRFFIRFTEEVYSSPEATQGALGLGLHRPSLIGGGCTCMRLVLPAVAVQEAVEFLGQPPLPLAALREATKVKYNTRNESNATPPELTDWHNPQQLCELQVCHALAARSFERGAALPAWPFWPTPPAAAHACVRGC
jgi:hypothetical protein